MDTRLKALEQKNAQAEARLGRAQTLRGDLKARISNKKEILALRQPLTACIRENTRILRSLPVRPPFARELPTNLNDSYSIPEVSGRSSGVTFPDQNGGNSFSERATSTPWPPASSDTRASSHPHGQFAPPSTAENSFPMDLHFGGGFRMTGAFTQPARRYMTSASIGAPLQPKRGYNQSFNYEHDVQGPAQKKTKRA